MGRIIDRRGFLKYMACVGTGLVWSFAEGVPVSRLIGQTHANKQADFSFIQISDSHIGFNKPANPDVTATLQAALDKIRASAAPDFLIHAGDLTHSSKPGEFETLNQLLGATRQQQVFYVPGEHDTSVDDGKLYLERYGKGSKGNGAGPPFQAGERLKREKRAIFRASGQLTPCLKKALTRPIAGVDWTYHL